MGSMKCITFYESVEWKEQYIPSAPTVCWVFTCYWLGASAPFVLQHISYEPIVKQVVTKTYQRKKEIR